MHAHTRLPTCIYTYMCIHLLIVRVLKQTHSSKVIYIFLLLLVQLIQKTLLMSIEVLISLELGKCCYIDRSFHNIRINTLASFKKYIYSAIPTEVEPITCSKSALILERERDLKGRKYVMMVLFLSAELSCSRVAGISTLH